MDITLDCAITYMYICFEESLVVGHNGKFCCIYYQWFSDDIMFTIARGGC